MNSGDIPTPEFQTTFNVQTLKHLHLDATCEGAWNISFAFGERMAIDGLGPIKVPLLPMVHCDACGATYEAPNFRRHIETACAHYLVLSSSNLSKGQIRFLRLYFNKSQEEFGAHIGVSDRQEMSRMESERSPRTLGPDRLVRLKLYCAKLLKIKDVEKIYQFNSVDEDKQADIPSTIFPSSKEAVMASLSTG